MVASKYQTPPASLFIESVPIVNFVLPEKIKLPKLKKVTSEGEVYAENSE